MAAKKATDPAIANISQTLFAVWEGTCGDAHLPQPTTLRHLASQLDPQPTDAQLLRAARVDPLSKRIKWPTKAAKDPDTRLEWKRTPNELKEEKQREADEKKRRLEHLPDELARRLVDLVHESIARDSLLTRAQLQQHPDILSLATPDKKAIAKAFARRHFLESIEATRTKGKGNEPHEAARLFPRWASGDDAILAALIRANLQDRAKTLNAGLDATKLLKEFKGPLEKPVAQLLDRFRQGQRHLRGVHFVYIAKDKPLYFATEALLPSPIQEPTPPFATPPSTTSPSHPQSSTPIPPTLPHDPATPTSQSFEPAFRETFDRLLQSNGGSALIRLAELRRSLPQFTRTEFDTGLRILRQSREFLLDRHDGIYGRLTPEDHDAAIEEYESTFIYVMRGSR